MLYTGTDPESYINEYTLVYEDKEEKKKSGVPGRPLELQKCAVIPRRARIQGS